MRRRYLVLASLAASLILLVAAVEWFTGLVTAAPQVDFKTIADIHPAVRVQINTRPIEDQLVDRIHASGRTAAPKFLLPSVLPHGFALWLAPNYERGMIELRGLIQEKRGGPLIARVLNTERSYTGIEQFAFDVDGVRAPRRGALTLAGWFPMERNAGEQIAQEFDSDPAPPLQNMDGGHLVEVHAENRNGAAYLVFASLLYAFDIDLDETEEKISLTSFRFVDQIVLTADVVLGDSIGIVCEMDIEPGQKNKLAVTNLKAGLEALLERLGEEWNRRHGLTVTGQSEWRGDTLVFTYRLDDVPALLKAIEGER